MSWLTGLAGRAEDILNKLDQNAATVLHQQQDENDSPVHIISDNKSVPQPLHEVKSDDNLVRRSTTPMKLRSVKSEKSFMATVTSNDDQQNGGSSKSSRRSSFSSKLEDGQTTVIEKTKNSSSNNFEALAYTANTVNTISLEQELAEIKSERDELKSENENLLDQLKSMNHIKELERLEDFCLSIEKERNDLLEKTTNLENSNQKYIKSISELETAISKIQQHENELSQKLEWAVQEKEQTAIELTQYRSRAQASLVSKEKLIEELKLGSSSVSRSKEMNGQSQQVEIENIRVENFTLNDQIRSLKGQLDQFRERFTQVELTHRNTLTEMEAKYEKLFDAMKVEQGRNRDLEMDLKARAQELSSVREEIVRLRSHNSKQQYEKEIEINRLKDRLVHQPESGTGGIGIEERLQSLTQSLVQKQTSLESLTAERNALRLQLEKVENNHRTTMLQLRQQRPQIVNMHINDTDDAKAQVPNFMQENPFDTGVARRVKRAYSSLDSVSIRLGVFLRRFPLIRIFVIIYMGLLHFWVLVVLLSTTPN